MKIMGEDQKRKLHWTIIIILLTQTEQISISEQTTKHSNETFLLDSIYFRTFTFQIIASSTTPVYGIVSIFPKDHFITTPPPPPF